MAEEKKEIEYVEVDKILIPEERITSQVDPEIMQELRESIKEHGILEPLLVAKVNNQYVLIDGLHRMVVAKELGIEKVPCIVKEMKEDELLITNLIVNRQRGRSNPAQEAKLVKLLIDKYNYSIGEVRRKLGISKQTIDRYYQIASRLSSKVFELFEQGLLSVGCAYWISFLDDPEKQFEIAQNAIEFNYTVEQCKEAVRQAMHPETPPPPGSWTFDETGRPTRVPVKAFPCLEDTDPSQITYIPVDINYLEDIKQMFAMYCKEVLGKKIGVQQEEQSQGAPQEEGAPVHPQQEQAQQPQKPQQQDWWPF